MPLPAPTFAAFGDHKVAYYSYGTGSEAAVFIHGWTCDSALWEPQQPLFTKFKRTVLVDYIGHGNSDAPEIDYNMETFARSTKAALDHARVEKAVIIAHSMGGPVTTTFLRLFTNMVKGIVYVDSFFLLPEHYKTLLELEDVRKSFADDAFHEPWVRMICTGATDEVTAKVVQRMTSTPKRVRLSAVGTHSRPHAWRWDEVYEIPALHIATMFKEMDGYWMHHIPRIELQEEEWRGCSHFPFLDRPERFNEVVEGWIKEKGLLLG